MRSAHPASDGAGIRSDIGRRFDRVGTEQFPGPGQQRAHLVELLLQHRVSHGSQGTCARMDPQFTTAEP